MMGKVGYFLPLTALLAPNKDFAIVRRRSDDVAVFRVGLRKRMGGLVMQSETKSSRDGDGGPMRRTRLRLRVWNLYKIWK